jgi:type VI secretion system secreted protein VgrG
LNLDTTFINLLVDHRDLVTSNRPVRLRIEHQSMFLEDVLLPQRVRGVETICGGFDYHVLCVALNVYLPLKEFIALPAAIDFVTDSGKLRTVTGVITEASSGDSDGGLASYQIVIRDALAVMDKRVNTRVFRNRNEVEIVQLLVDEWLQTSPVLATQFRLQIDELMTPSKYPAREFTMQYNESDAAFIRRLLKRRGINWHFQPDADKNYLAHCIVLWDHFESARPNAAGTVRYHRDAATEERDSITSWNAVRTLQAGSVSRHSWNYKDPYGPYLMSMTTESQVTQCHALGDIGVTLNDYQVLMPHAGDNHDDLVALGTLAMKRHDLETKCFHGEGSVRDFCAGESFMLAGHPEIDRHPRAEREFVITELHIAAQNNLPKELAERVEKLFRRSRWHDADFEDLSASGRRSKISFTAVRKGIDIVPGFDARTDLPRVHMQTAMVVGPQNEEVHCDELYRVRIRMTGTREADHAHSDGNNGASDTDRDSAWVRVATNWAGDGPTAAKQCGSLSLPRVGSEVLLAFLGGDPDKPIIVGQLYNQKSVPPALSPAGALPGNRYLSGLRSKEVKGGGRGNQLCFDDTKDQISAQLASDHGNSQLNLGFLIDARKQEGRNQRGQGIELRTDQQMALRAAQGLLLSGWKQECADHHMGSPELIGLLNSLIALSASFERNSNLNSTVATSEGAVLFPFLNGSESNDQKTTSAIGITAPQGISFATPSNIVSYAGACLELAATGCTQILSGDSISLKSESGMSLFTRTNGITAIAEQGKIVLQSQKSNTEICASKDVLVTAVDGGVRISGREITIVSDSGTFIKIGDGIVFGTEGSIKYHATDFSFMGAQSLKRVQDVVPNDECQDPVRKIIVELVDADGNSPTSEPVELIFPRDGISRSVNVVPNGSELDVPSGCFLLRQKERIKKNGGEDE